MAKIASVKGTRDFYPEKMAIHNWIVDGWRTTSLRNGFVEYDGPIFEYLQLYTQKSGEEIASQLFSFTDRGGRDLALRPEITPTLARMVNQQINSLPRPIKWFSIPRLCRAERPQRGRLREFFQWNIDIIGDDSPLSDAECIYTAVDYLRSVGLTSEDVVVKISSRSLLAVLLKTIGFVDDQFEKIYALLDKRAKLSPKAFEEMATEQIPDKSLRTELMETVNDVSKDHQDALAKLKTPYNEELCNEADKVDSLFEYLIRMGIDDYCEFDINIVRGLAYYTGAVFEIFDRKTPLRALCGGGRYDNLLAGLGGQQVPATGFGLGDVVLEILLEEKNLLGSAENNPDFYVIDAGRETKPKAVELASQLRSQGLSAIFSYKSLSVGKQLKLASAQKARFVVLVEENKQISLKNMSDGKQRLLSWDDFLASPLPQGGPDA